MFSSFRIGRLFGIEVRCDWSFVFFLLFLIQVAPPQNSLLVALLLAALFASVLLHELGHALVARWLAIEVLDIRLWPLGGMARMGEIPEDPRTESLIAVAGPAVNIALGLLLLGGAQLFDPNLALLANMNLGLGTLNLLPGFPMDGGRLLRAWLARRHSWPVATRQAVRVGRWVAGLALLLAITLGDTWSFLAVSAIAAFVWLSGTRELISVRLRHGLSPFGDPLPGTPTREAQQPVWPTQRDSSFADAGPGEARRPLLWELEEPRQSRDGRMGEDYLRYLEAFRGRLGRPGEEPEEPRD